MGLDPALSPDAGDDLSPDAVEAVSVSMKVPHTSQRHPASQRALAEAIGWGQASLNRAEQDASPLALRKVETFLRHLGYRLAIVPADANPAATLGEDPDETWGVPDRVLKHEAAWTWQRPRTISRAPGSHSDGGVVGRRWVS